MTIQKTADEAMTIAYETVGPPDGEPVLLVMGTGGQMLSWPAGFLRLLVEQGFRVTRFDNRDSGLSTHLTEAGTPSRLTMLLRPRAAACYRLEDMADDAVAVLDALHQPAAHIVGMSQGGMIAQAIAVRHPGRVRTLTSISSAPAPRIGQPGPRTLLKIIKTADPRRVTTREDAAQYVVDVERAVGSPAYAFDEASLRELGRQCFDRAGFDMAAVQRQTAAIAASGDRRAALAHLRVPTLVVHGEADPLIRPRAAVATAGAIPGAKLITYPGMGHDLPRELWPAIVKEITELITTPAR
jgi:pimeloyl-ACP methyl ester carboxylesterase